MTLKNLQVLLVISVLAVAGRPSSARADFWSKLGKAVGGICVPCQLIDCAINDGELNDRKNELNNLESHMGGLRQQYDAINAEKQSLQADIAGKQDRLAKQQAEFNEQSEKFNAGLAQAKANVPNLIEDLNQILNRVKMLRDQADTLDRFNSRILNLSGALNSTLSNQLFAYVEVTGEPHQPVPVVDGAESFDCSSTKSYLQLRGIYQSMRLAEQYLSKGGTTPVASAVSSTVEELQTRIDGLSDLDRRLDQSSDAAKQ